MGFLLAWIPYHHRFFLWTFPNEITTCSAGPPKLLCVLVFSDNYFGQFLSPNNTFVELYHFTHSFTMCGIIGLLLANEEQHVSA